MDVELLFTNRPSFNIVTGYKRLGYTQDYINQKYHSYFDALLTAAEKKAKLTELAILSGYAKIYKFETHQQEFITLKRPVPVKFMNALGIDNRILDFTVELDLEHYKAAFGYQYQVGYFITRYLAAVYSSRDFPEPVPEEEAIAIVKAFCMEKQLQCLINVLNLKSVFFFPNGDIKYKYFYPEYSKKGAFYTFTAGNKDYGTTKVG